MARPMRALDVAATFPFRIMRIMRVMRIVLKDYLKMRGSHH